MPCSTIELHRRLSVPEIYQKNALAATLILRRNDFFNNPLRIFWILHLNTIDASFLGGIIITAGIERITNEDHIADRDLEVPFDLPNAITLVDTFARNVYR